MRDRDTLVYVSNNALISGGTRNPFLSQEAPFLSAMYRRVYIVSPRGIYTPDDGSGLTRISGVSRWDKLLAAVCGIFSVRAAGELLHMLIDRHVSPRDAARLVLFSVHGMLLYRLVKRTVKPLQKSKCMLYSYWLSYDAYAAAMAQKRWPACHSVARAHSYEIQLSRNTCNPYMMKRFIGRHIRDIHFISECAKREFSAYTNIEALRAATHVTYIGSPARDTGWKPLPDRRRYRILSCSNLLPVKQLHLLILALSGWSLCELEWVHIGGGPLAAELEALAKEKLEGNPMVRYRFTGILPNEQTRETMRGDVDCFINCSRSEGVPITIMEAMSFGIPVIAPSINGIPELVDKTCGILYNATDNELQLKSAMEKFFGRTCDDRVRMRRASYEKWNDRFVLDRNIQAVI